MLNTIIVSPNSLVGNVFLTEFTFQSTVSSATSYAWDFGDGSVFLYDSSVVSHIYNYPGTYAITCSAWESNANPPYVSQQFVTVDFVYPNKVVFSQIPSSYSIPGQKTNTPFVVSLTSTEIQDSLYLTMQALNTNSIPFDSVPPKWNFITPKWRFIDANTNEIVTDGLLVKTAPIYQEYNGTLRVVAVSGEASFYYVDDLSTKFNGANGLPVLIVATLSTEAFVYPPDSQIYSYNSYSNNESAKAALLWQVNEYFPTNLKVTENFISDTYPIKWTGVPIPTMVTLQFDSRLNPNFAYVPLLTADILDYPKTNEIGSTYPVNLLLSNSVSGIPEQEEIYFSNTDANDNLNSGYVYTSITPVVSTTDLTTIIASTTGVNTFGSESFHFPVGYPIYSNAYIFNPFNQAIDKISLTNCPQSNSYIQQYKELGVLSDGKVDIWNSIVSVPNTLRTTQLTSVEALSAFKGLTPPVSSAPIYGLAVDPILGRTYVCDPLSGTIFATDFDGNLVIPATNILSYGIDSLSGSLLPCSISLDQSHNIWVSLYAKKSLLKLDSNLNFVCSADFISPNVQNALVAPPIVKTDMRGNVWSCFAESSAGYVSQFNLSGQSINNICLSAYASSVSVPVSLAIDAKNTVWVACYNSNLIINLSSDGTAVDTLSGGFTRPNNLAIDSLNNIWFTHGYGFVSKYNSLTKQLDTWQIDTVGASIIPSTELYPALATPPYDEIWGGLTIDVYDRVWAIDTSFNNVAVFNSQNVSDLRVINSQPHMTVSLITYAISGLDIPSPYIHSFQAAGDWTGNEWYQKYAAPIEVLPISGVSSPFTVLNLDGTYSVAKVNEEFDISAYFQSLALPETLSQNPLFFEEFLAAVAGDGNITAESAGRVIYERIANFIQTHGDFETSEITQLLSYAKQLSVPTRTYGIDFPAEINRLINIFSIPKKYLRGRINYDPDINNNIGPILTETDTISAGQFLYVREKSSNTYSIVYVTALEDGTTVYPLSQLHVPGFKSPIQNYYYFFENLQTKLGYTENIINWDSLYTTFDYTLSSNEEWYGDNGLLETVFNNILTRRLTE